MVCYCVALTSSSDSEYMTCNAISFWTLCSKFRFYANHEKFWKMSSCCCNVLYASMLIHSWEVSKETLYCCCNVLSFSASGCDSNYQASKEWQASEFLFLSWRFWRSQARGWGYQGSEWRIWRYWRSQARLLTLSRFWLKILNFLNPAVCFFISCFINFHQKSMN